MQGQDLEVFKDIPGYKAILKAVLKSQIQCLVEQLASQTGEESVLLTASVEEGTLSHLGSDFGKVFLDGHDDIKSQFLGFCLKRHHLKVSSSNMTKAQLRKRGPKGPVKRPRLNYPSAQPQSATYHQTSETTLDSSHYDNKKYVPEIADTFASPGVHVSSMYITENNLNDTQQNSETMIKQEPNDTNSTQQFGHQTYTEGDQMIHEDSTTGAGFKQETEGAETTALSQGLGSGLTGSVFDPKEERSPQQGSSTSDLSLNTLMSLSLANNVNQQPICVLCHKPFKNMRNLKFHMMSHKGVRPYACMFCPKSFSQKNVLDQHLCTHTGLKPFQCISCGRAFSQRSTLYRHEKVHTRNRDGTLK